MLVKRRLKSDHKNATYKQRSKRYYNSKVRVRQFQVSDLILKKIQGPKGMFGPNWEGPFRVFKWLSHRAYELEHPDGTPDPYPWNAYHLKKYYQ
ncbi:hypothetical protein ACS0TY_018178 [Phlomoides rotata]